MVHLSVRICIALAITAQAISGHFSDNPSAGGPMPMPANRGGEGFFKDNPFSNGGGQNEMPGTAPAMADGIPSMSNGIPPSTGGSGTNPDLSPSPLLAQCPGTFPSEEEILEDKPGCPATRAFEPTNLEDLSFEHAPTCPDDDGKLYQSRGGATFMVQCCTHGGGEPIRTIIAEDFRRCMSNCSATDECHSVQYTARPYGEPVGTCIMNKKGGFGKAQCAVSDQHSYAFVVDPPTIEPASQQMMLKCSTECPSGHGQSFRTESGEIFRLTCGKRHGTKMLHRDTQPTMMDCMNHCGKLMHCDSVDYDPQRRICYYSNHRAEPATEALLFASAYSLGCGICGHGA